MQKVKVLGAHEFNDAKDELNLKFLELSKNIDESLKIEPNSTQSKITKIVFCNFLRDFFNTTKVLITGETKDGRFAAIELDMESDGNTVWKAKSVRDEENNWFFELTEPFTIGEENNED